MQDLENFTIHKQSSLKDLFTIYPTKQQKGWKREKWDPWNRKQGHETQYKLFSRSSDEQREGREYVEAK